MAREVVVCHVIILIVEEAQLLPILVIYFTYIYKSTVLWLCSDLDAFAQPELNSNFVRKVTLKCPTKNIQNVEVFRMQLMNKDDSLLD